MNINDFIINIPATTRERDSKIKAALDNGKIYISLITKNNKKHFKIYYKKNDVIKTKQLKTSKESEEYILKNKNIITFSDGAKEYLEL